MECAHCGTENPKRACGNECGTLYCNDQCAQSDWIGAEMPHWELCGKKYGSGGPKWARGMHLKRGALTRAAHRRHESVGEYRDEISKDIHRTKGKHRFSAKTRHREQFLENVSGGKK